jgi:GT2 family glycosyltransferase
VSATLTSVIVPCWNALTLTRVCLRQLARSTTSPYELIAIDNGSTDGTGAWLAEFRARLMNRNPRGALRRLHIVSNAKNLGYPAAMNQGIRAARGRYLLFGNNDVAVTPLWLEHMLGALRSRPRIGGVSAFSNPARRPDEPISWACRPHYRGLKGLERYASASELRGRVPAYFPVPGLFPGFWFLTKRSVLDVVGVFDQRYAPGGFEDLDMQWRMRRAGFALGFSGRAFVHHVSFGCAQMNGLKSETLYGPDRARLLHRKFPETAALPYSESPEFWLAAGRR